MISAKEMKELEHWATQQGISIEELMENAGKAVFETVREKYDLVGKQIVVFCGQGNNGDVGGHRIRRDFPLSCADAQGCLVTVQFRHLAIHKNQIVVAA